MRCGNCGHKLTAAALAMGYCPQCGAELRSEGAQGMDATGASVMEEAQPQIVAPGQGTMLPPPPAAALPSPPRMSVPLAGATPGDQAPLPPGSALPSPPGGRTSVPQPPSTSMPHPSLMNFPPTPPPSGNGAAPQGSNRPLAGHELGDVAPAPNANAPAKGANAPPVKPPQAPLIVSSSRSDVPPPPPPPQALHAAPPAYVPPAQNGGEPPHARSPKPARIVDANPTPNVVDSAAPLTILPPAQRRSPLPAILGTVFILIAVVLGALYIAGNRGIGPLAAGTHPGTSSTASQTASPTAPPADTATPVPPTDTPVPPTATPQPTVPPAQAGYTTYTSGDGVFGLNYPNDWNAPDANPTAQGNITPYNFVSQTTTNEAVTIDRSSVTITPSNIQTYLENFVVNSNGSSFAVTQSPTSQKVGATTWMVAEGTYMTSGGEHKVIGLATNDGSNGFLFFYDAPISSFNAAPGSTYDTMVTSFTFLR